MKDKVINIGLILFYTFLILLLIILACSIFYNHFSPSIVLKSKHPKYNTNEIIIEYNEDQIQKLFATLNGQTLELKNNQELILSNRLDGSKHIIVLDIIYSDGSKETIKKEYEIYSECNNNIKNSKIETKCNEECGTGSKIIITKKIDKNTDRICSQEEKQIECKLSDCDNSTDFEGHNQSDGNTSNGINNNQQNVQNNLDSNTNNDSQVLEKHTCKLIVTDGKLGANQWYVSDLNIQLDMDKNNISQYGISTSSNVTYNKIQNISVTKETAGTTYYGYVKYKDGSASKCKLFIKLDKTRPTMPTSTIRQDNSTGKILNNTKSYRNYKVWWGDFKANDSLAKIDHFEFSSKCSGKKTANLVDYYQYPLNSSLSFNSYYCIRSVDKAGNVSNWSTPYYFYVDLVTPTCSITKSNNTIIVNGSDKDSGISSYSINNSEYGNKNTINVTEGSKITASVKDKAGNIGACSYTDRIKTMIIIGDSRTYYIGTRFSAQRIINPDVYEVEKSKVYLVARHGGYYNWFSDGGYTRFCPANVDCTLSAVAQLDKLLAKLQSEKKYRDVVILSNLGVNDLNQNIDVTTAANIYISKYNNLINNNWKSKNYLNISFAFISVNPIDEKLIQCITTNNRTNAKINQFNGIMKSKYKYFDSNSIIKNQNFGTTYDISNSCPNGDGLHYNETTDKKIYTLYKDFVF